MPLQATSGAASYDAFGGGVPAVPQYIEDVFSTWLYTGNSTTGGTQTITNNIDLSTKGGMVWIKGRSAASDHILTDTSRGAGTTASNNQGLASNLNAAEDLGASYDFLSAFNTNGFTVKQGGTTATTRGTNYNAVTYASWTFREQPKFFDVVTYTGDGNIGRTVSHSLNATVGFMLIKCTSQPGGWVAYHRSIGASQFLTLNATDAAGSGSGGNTPAKYWNSTAPTSTVFSLGDAANTNETGQTYVAYLFAHDAGGFGLTGTDNVISCGTYAGNGSGSGSNTINLGYEPQYLLVKRSSGGVGSWWVIDNMRGATADGNDKLLAANTTAAEVSDQKIAFTATGFTLYDSSSEFNASGSNYIYIAIRRGPMKVPTSGASVYNGVTWTGNNAARTITGIGFPLDMCFTHIRNVSGTSAQSLFFDRFRGNANTTSAKRLTATSTAAETDYTSVGTFDRMDGFRILDGDGLINDAGLPSTYVGYFFKRAPSFFDVVCYTGTGVLRTITHNLGAVPELIIIKKRSAVGSWVVYVSPVGNTKALFLNSTSTPTTDTSFWNNTSPTASVFTVNVDNDINDTNKTQVAYLFATCAGVSKVGSYTGTGTTLQIDCGFTGGARFVLIKRTDSTGDWYVWDTARGIVSGNDPYLLLNSTAAEVTSTDYIDTYSAGFEISSTAPAAINASGGTFIFLAIA